MAKIFIADDELASQWAAVRTLSRSGHDLVEAKGGSEALAYLKAYGADLIILELRLQHISGAEVCRRIKALPGYERIPVLILANLFGPGDVRAAWQAGADLVLAKPLSCCALAEVVDNLLQSGPAAVPHAA